MQLCMSVLWTVVILDRKLGRHVFRQAAIVLLQEILPIVSSKLNCCFVSSSSFEISRLIHAWENTL